MKLHIVTPCSRPENLIKIFNTITFPCDWWIVFDATDDEFNACFVNFDLDFLKCNWIHLLNYKFGKYGNMQRNIALGNITEGFIYFLDDDNIMHSAFYNTTKNIIKNDSKIRCVLYSQILENNSIRFVDSSKIKPCNIDQGQYLVDRKLIGESRFCQEAIGDGIFIRDIFDNNDKSIFYFCNDNVTYYNKIKKNISMKKNVIFYNAYHKGDLHYSRQFMKDIQIKLSSQYNNFYYCDNYPNDNIYFDLDNFKRIPYENMPDNNLQVTSDENNIYINTWIGQKGQKYIADFFCSLRSYHNMYIDIYKNLGIQIRRIDSYIPIIDYMMLDQQYMINILNFNSSEMFNGTKKKILICNGDVLSNQSENFEFRHIINILAFMHLDCTFICTEKSFTPTVSNIVFCEDIIKKDGCDLNEISYLSTFCDIIVGRASGPYTFTHVKENIGNSNMKYISLCNSKFEGIWYQGKASNSWSNKYDINNIVDMINLKINE